MFGQRGICIAWVLMGRYCYNIPKLIEKGSNRNVNRLTEIYFSSPRGYEAVHQDTNNIELDGILTKTVKISIAI